MSETETDELVIDSSNFNEHFFDVRKFGPKDGQIMARFRAPAVFGSGLQKQDIIALLKKDKATQAAMVMRKIHLAKEPDCYRLLAEMCDDLISGMTDEEVEAKEYEFILEAFYYTKRENVPQDDPHWVTIELSTVAYDEETKTFKVSIDLDKEAAKNS